MLWESTQNAPLRTLPMLIETLINNCQALFGSQVVSLLGEVANDSGAEESDSLHCKYNYFYCVNLLNLLIFSFLIIAFPYSPRSLVGLSGIKQRPEIPQSRLGFNSFRRRPREPRTEPQHCHFPPLGLG